MTARKIVTALAAAMLFATLGIRSASADSGVDLKGAKVLASYQDGSKKYILADGSEALIRPDGTAEVDMPDGTRVLTWPGGARGAEIKRVIYIEGAIESFYYGGATKKVYRNGTVVETWPPDGKHEIRRETRPDGSVEALFADGAKRIVSPDGREVTTWPDGSVRDRRPDGTVWGTSTAHRTLLNPDMIALDSYPEKVDVGAKTVFAGALRPPFVNPWASIMIPDGSVRTIPADKVKIDGRRFSFEVDFDAGPGRYKIEILASGRYGNAVAANFPLWVGTASPKADQPTMYPLADPKTPTDVLESKFWEMVNKTRTLFGQSELPWDPEVAQLSRNHARDMAANHFFGHVSPTYGNLAKRAVKLYGWQTTIWGIPDLPPEPGRINYIADNLSRTNSLADALESLLESPAHRKVLLHKYFTAGGVGVSWEETDDGPILLVVTALIQKNRVTVAPKTFHPRKPVARPPDGNDHIWGLDHPKQK